MFDYGSFTNFPSITWPSHNAIGTGAWGGHHDIVNPTYYLRETRETVTPQGQQFDTAKFLGDGVETLYEAFHRVFGPWQGHERRVHGIDPRAVHARRRSRHARAPRHRRPRPPAGDHGSATPAIPTRSGTPMARRARTGSRSSRTAASRRPSCCTPTRRTRRRSSCSTRCPSPTASATTTDRTPTASAPRSTRATCASAACSRRWRRAGCWIARCSSSRLTTAWRRRMRRWRRRRYRAVTDAGMKAVTPDPLVYLIDMAVTVTPHEDGRTAMVEVLANDADASGERPPVEGAEVTLIGHGGKSIARAKTDAGGTCGLALPLGCRSGRPGGDGAPRRLQPPAPPPRRDAGARGHPDAAVRARGVLTEAEESRSDVALSAPRPRRERTGRPTNARAASIRQSRRPA